MLICSRRRLTKCQIRTSHLVLLLLLLNSLPQNNSPRLDRSRPYHHRALTLILVHNNKANHSNLFMRLTLGVVKLDHPHLLVHHITTL